VIYLQHESAPSALQLSAVYSKSMFSSRKKKNVLAKLVPANRLASQSQVSQQLQFPTKSRSNLQSPQEKQQSQLPVCPWSAHAPPSRQSPSPFLRDAHALSTIPNSSGELYLFGGYVQSSDSPSNDLYVISTRDFSTSLLRTSGDIPNPRYGHRAVLTSITLLIWGGKTDFTNQNAENQSYDDSFYLLNLGTSDLFDVNTRSS